MDIATFDTQANATAAFPTVQGRRYKFIAGRTEEGTTVTDSFSKGRVDSKVEKEFHCAQRAHQYSCGSIPSGLPAIVIMRLPIEADWQQGSPAATEDDPMAGLERTFAKTDAQAKAMRLVDERLQMLGLDVQLPGEKMMLRRNEGQYSRARLLALAILVFMPSPVAAQSPHGTDLRRRRDPVPGRQYPRLFAGGT
ncbi:MAG: hypothetical protein IPO50_10750 [Sphingomonadales bacterium]|nr:hypothetical protein [Sphingomonadales bacterium]